MLKIYIYFMGGMEKLTQKMLAKQILRGCSKHTNQIQINLSFAIKIQNAQTDS